MNIKTFFFIAKSKNIEIELHLVLKTMEFDVKLKRDLFI
jgi:hypothetical protein